MWHLFVLALMGLVYAENGTNVKGPVFTYVGTNKTVGEDCTSCASKCCPGTQIYMNDTCGENVHGVKKLQDMHVDIYTNDISKTDFTLKRFRFVHSDVLFNDSTSGFLFLENGEALYMLENGKFYYRRPNYAKQWGTPFAYNELCTEVQVRTGPDGVPIPGSEELVYRGVDSDIPMDPEGDKKDYVSAGAMLVSCFFLLLVLAAYAVLPQKRNLPSLMLMAYVSCLATAFVLIPVQVFANLHGKWKCVPLGLAVYYSFLASFTWLNVMSYDMWSTTCKNQMPRWEPRRKILAKFGWYSLYGFGAPLLATLFLVGIDYPDLTSVPDFIQPHFVFGNPIYCTFENENERHLYVHVPILVATVLNIFFCVMTGLFIGRNSSKPGGTGESRNTKKDQSRYIIYVKLILIMGVNWILDVASAFIYPKSKVWYISDVFNSLVGLFIFIIFVCKKDMLLMLCKRFSIKTRFVRQSESTVESSVSVSKRQPSDKEAGSTNMIPDAFSEKPAFINYSSQGRY